MFKRILKSINTRRILKRVEELERNNEFLMNENAVLKQINRKRYLQQEDKMEFLIKRENRLQEIEQMVKNGDNWRAIKAKIGEVYENWIINKT